MLEITAGTGADLTFECAGVNAVPDTVLDMVKLARTMATLSIWGHPATVDVRTPVLKEIDLRGTIAYAGGHRAVIELVQTVTIDLAPFITHGIRPEPVDIGFDTLINHTDTAVKIPVEPVVLRGDRRDGSVPEGDPPVEGRRRGSPSPVFET